jgi:hypothetical protein
VRTWVADRSGSAGASGAPREPSLRDRMAAGMITGGIGSALSCPLDVVRTRMQVADARASYVLRIRSDSPFELARSRRNDVVLR